MESRGSNAFLVTMILLVALWLAYVVKSSPRYEPPEEGIKEDYVVGAGSTLECMRFPQDPPVQIEEGDTLSGLVAEEVEYRSSNLGEADVPQQAVVEAVALLNHISDPGLIQVGDKVLLFEWCA